MTGMRGWLQLQEGEEEGKPVGAKLQEAVDYSPS